jgi:hypothetical protein
VVVYAAEQVAGKQGVKKRTAAPFVIRLMVILLVLTMGGMIFLALLPQLISIEITTGPYLHACSTSYIALKNTGLFPVTLSGWEIGYEESSTYVLPTSTLFPGEAVRVWCGFGQNDAHNLYAGCEEPAWSLVGLKVQGKVLHIRYYWTDLCHPGSLPAR